MTKEHDKDRERIEEPEVENAIIEDEEIDLIEDFEDDDLEEDLDFEEDDLEEHFEDDFEEDDLEEGFQEFFEEDDLEDLEEDFEETLEEVDSAEDYEYEEEFEEGSDDFEYEDDYDESDLDEEDFEEDYDEPDEDLEDLEEDEDDYEDLMEDYEEEENLEETEESIEETPESDNPPEGKKNKKLIYILSTVLILSLVVRSLFFSFTLVEGVSMSPTLEHRDFILVNKIGNVEDFKRGDIIIFDGGNNTYYVKRIVALPGETLEIIDSRLHINGELQPEPYLPQQTELIDDVPATTIPEGAFYVIGDNRPFSMDSRNGLGLPTFESIIGKRVLTIPTPF